MTWARPSYMLPGSRAYGRTMTMSKTDEAIATTSTRGPAPSGTGASSLSRADWLLPAGLIMLSFIPFVAGIFRVVGLASGAEVTPENARFFAVPLPVVLHILG